VRELAREIVPALKPVLKPVAVIGMRSKSSGSGSVDLSFSQSISKLAIAPKRLRRAASEASFATLRRRRQSGASMSVMGLLEKCCSQS
jgi:hypothetical protein